jgi:hypothetical protein
MVSDGKSLIRLPQSISMVRAAKSERYIEQILIKLQSQSFSDQERQEMSILFII